MPYYNTLTHYWLCVQSLFCPAVSGRSCPIVLVLHIRTGPVTDKVTAVEMGRVIWLPV